MPRFKDLRTLKLQVGLKTPIMKLFQQLKCMSVECVELTNGEMDRDTVTAICEVKSLRKLTLTDVSKFKEKHLEDWRSKFSDRLQDIRLLGTTVDRYLWSKVDPVLESRMRCTQ